MTLEPTANNGIKEHTHEELEQIYTDADSCDKQLFAEQRSNVLLIAGEHYTKKVSKFFSRLRDAKDVSDEQKLRLTKNHIQKIVKGYANNIVSLAPGVSIGPKNENELQDQKAAEMHDAVWKDGKDRFNYDSMIDEWADNFCGIGEVATKIFFDPLAGNIKSFNAQMGLDGQPLKDANGQLVAGAPNYQGDFVLEEVLGFNLLRDPSAKSMKDSLYLIVRKMGDLDDLLLRFEGDPDKQKLIQSSQDETFLVFNGQDGGYKKADKQVLIKEYYFRPSARYPKGYFYIETKEGNLFKGELPGGIFPIAFAPMERIPTTPRGRSIVKVLRPYQAEVNRAASKMAEHQITLGDDKLILMNGSKVSAGVSLPGVRTITANGQTPTVMPGRDGSQYLAYMQSQIDEMYRVSDMMEMEADQNGQMDAYALLFRAASQKKKFQRYIKRFEFFLKDVCKIYLSLAKIHLSDDAVVLATGRSERVNISEFKNTTELCYQIKIEPQSDDIETKMGKQLVLNHLVQYTGTKLDKEDLGKLVRLMPYANMEEGFSDLTMDYDSATNDILALDRGEPPMVHDYDNHPYMIKRLVSRMRQADFKFLSQQVQQNYLLKIQKHEEAQTENIRKIQQAESGFIPTGGHLVAVDLYVGDPNDPLRSRRARLPYEALSWLVQKLDAQGQSQEMFSNMNQGAMAQMAGMLGKTSNGGAPNGMGASPNSNGGAGMPPGASNEPSYASPGGVGNL